jgi:hypothetical protein
MLSVTALSGFGSGSAPSLPTINQTTRTTDTASRTVYTFTSQDVGVASPNRMVLVGTNCGGGSNGKVTGLTVDGNDATLVVEADWGASATNSSLHQYALTSGTSVTIVVTYGAGKPQCGLVVWDIQNTLTTPTDTGYRTDTTDPMTDDLNVLANSIVVGMVGNGGATHTWTGLDEEMDETMEGTRVYTSASKFVATADSSYTVTCDATAMSEAAFCIASFPPS